MECRYCKSVCIKAGIQKGIQKYKCKACGKYQQQQYRQSARQLSLNTSIVQLLKEGCGNRSICRILGIAMNTLLRRIRAIPATVTPSHSYAERRDYEADELRTFAGNKKNEIWIIYAIGRQSRKVVSLLVGARTKTNVSFITAHLLLLKPKQICTDRLTMFL